MYAKIELQQTAKKSSMVAVHVILKTVAIIRIVGWVEVYILAEYK